MVMTLEKDKNEAVFEVDLEHFLRREAPAAGRAHQLWGMLELCVSQISRKQAVNPHEKTETLKPETGLVCRPKI